MASQRWSEAELLLVKTLTEQGVNSAEIARKCREGGISRTQKAIMRIQARKGWRAQVPQSPLKRHATKPLHVEGDVLVLPDIHAPCHDARWINRVCDLAYKWNIKQAIIAGDLADFNSFSVFGRDAGIDADMELDSLSAVMDALCASFEIYYFAGNHDVRPCRALRDAGLNVKWLMRMFTPDEHCHISDWFWCTLTSGGAQYHVEHPKNTSINAGIVPAKLASAYLKSTIGTHGHVWGMRRDVSGKYWAIDSGVCADPDLLLYTTMRHSTRPIVYQGAVIVRDSVPILLSPDNMTFYETMKIA